MDGIRELWNQYALADVTNLAIFKDKSRVVAFDGRSNAVLIIEPILKGNGEIRLKFTEPDNAEKDLLLLELGLVSEKEVLKLGKRIKNREKRKKILKSLMTEFMPDFQKLSEDIKIKEASGRILSHKSDRELIAKSIEIAVEDLVQQRYGELLNIIDGLSKKSE